MRTDVKTVFPILRRNQNVGCRPCCGPIPVRPCRRLSGGEGMYALIVEGGVYLRRRAAFCGHGLRI